MTQAKEIDKQFRELSEDCIKEYEGKLKSFKEQHAKRIKRLQENEQEVREILQSSKIEIQRLERLENKDSENLKEFLSDIRPKLVDRPSNQTVKYKERSLRSWVKSQTSTALISPYGATLLAPDRKLIENIKGEAGNPWILPSNPEDTNIKFTSSGSGWGCWATGIPFPIEHNIWFYFIPDTTAIWELTALIGFFGFYILRANDKWYNCKSAEVLLEARINVYQYFYHGWKNFTLTKKADDNIEYFDYFDEVPFLTYSTSLKAEDGVWVRAQVRILAFANGSGSYAEINFSDGDANFIKPYFLSAAHR